MAYTFQLCHLYNPVFRGFYQITLTHLGIQDGGKVDQPLLVFFQMRCQVAADDDDLSIVEREPHAHATWSRRKCRGLEIAQTILG